MNILERFGLLFKSTINKWFTKVVDLLHSKADLISTATQIVTNVNNFVQSSTADIITAVIPGNIDDTVKTLARKWLPLLIVKLHTVEDYAGLSDDEIVAKFVASLPDMIPEEKTFVLHNLAALLALKITNNTINLGDIFGIIEGTYQSITKKNIVQNVTKDVPDFLADYTKGYPNENAFVVTSDSQVFLMANEADAIAHQKTIDATQTVSIYQVK